MPRFLNVWTGVFEWHTDPSEVRYAILSHTWLLPEQGGEQSYADVCKLQATMINEGRDPRPSVSNMETLGYDPYGTIFAHPELSDKIKGICKVAREAGFRLIWIDSCCIDKTSSAELSEAINSMYDWYRLSDACYVYLADVPDGDDPRAPESAFRRSRWHTRCWTLQELIAPRHVEFLTQTWGFLSTKTGLATTLERITGVDFETLTSLESVDLASVARRMSWAAKREATRIEDTAYSLMGIFGVHMSPIYGEGLHAFLRLQEEIVRTIPDQSIFAWRAEHYRPIIRLAETSLDFHYGLFAPHPIYFISCGQIIPTTRANFASRLHLESTEDVPQLLCVFTPQGARMDLLTVQPTSLPMHVLDEITSADSPTPCSEYRETLITMPGMLFALLQCEDRTSGSLIILPIQHAPPTGEGTRPRRGSFVEARHRCKNPRHKGYWNRLCHLGENALLELLSCTKPAVSELHLLTTYITTESSLTCHHKTYRSSMLDLALWQGHHEDDIVFQIAPRCLKVLSSLGFSVSSHMPRVVRYSEQELSVKIVLAYPSGDVASGHGCPQTIEITLVIKKESSQNRRTVDFYVVNFLGVPINNAESSSRFHSTTTSPEMADHSIVMMATSVGHEYYCFSHNWWTRPTITTTEWLPGDVPFRCCFVYSDPPKCGQGPQFTSRSLEISVRPFLDDSDTLHPNYMWLYIDLSEKRTFWLRKDERFWYRGQPYSFNDSREDQEVSQSGDSHEDTEVHLSSVGSATSSTFVPRESLPDAPFMWDRKSPYKTRPSATEVGRISLPGHRRSYAASSRFDKEAEGYFPATEQDTELSSALPTASSEPLVRVLSESTDGANMDTVVSEMDSGEVGADGTPRGRRATDEELRLRAAQDTILYELRQDAARVRANRKTSPVARTPEPYSPLESSSDAESEDGHSSSRSATPSSTSPAPSSSPHPEGARELVSEDQGALNAGREPEDHDAWRRENDTLRTRISAMAAENASLSARVETMSARIETMSAQMATVLARLQDLPATQGPNAAGDVRPSNSPSKTRDAEVHEPKVIPMPAVAPSKEKGKSRAVTFSPASPDPKATASGETALTIHASLESSRSLDTEDTDEANTLAPRSGVTVEAAATALEERDQAVEHRQASSLPLHLSGSGVGVESIPESSPGHVAETHSAASIADECVGILPEDAEAPENSAERKINNVGRRLVNVDKDIREPVVCTSASMVTECEPELLRDRFGELRGPASTPSQDTQDVRGMVTPRVPTATSTAPQTTKPRASLGDAPSVSPILEDQDFPSGTTLPSSAHTSSNERTRTQEDLTDTRAPKRPRPTMATGREPVAGRGTAPAHAPAGLSAIVRFGSACWSADAAVIRLEVRAIARAAWDALPLLQEAVVDFSRDPSSDAHVLIDFPSAVFAQIFVDVWVENRNLTPNHQHVEAFVL